MEVERGGARRGGQAHAALNALPLHEEAARRALQGGRQIARGPYCLSQGLRARYRLTSLI